MMDIKSKFKDHVIIPVIITFALSVSYYFIIYNRNAVNILDRLIEPLFLYFTVLIPLFLTIAFTFFYSKNTWVGIFNGISLVVSSYCGTLMQINNIFLKDPFIPQYYLDFQKAGSFNLIFFFFGILFIIVGYAAGFMTKALEPEKEVDKSIGQLSKSQRRSKKKRKKAKQKNQEEISKIVDDIFEK